MVEVKIQIFYADNPSELALGIKLEKDDSSSPVEVGVGETLKNLLTKLFRQVAESYQKTKVTVVEGE